MLIGGRPQVASPCKRHGAPLWFRPGPRVRQEITMGLLDVLNGMQQGPRGPSDPSAKTGGGMSPMTMAILALLAWKAVKHLSGPQTGASPAPAPSPGNANAGGSL